MTANTAEAQRVRKHATMISVVTLVVSAANYGFSLAAVRLLPTGAYARFASAQGLLLILGTGCMAAIPWAIARHVATHDRSGHASAEAFTFGLLAASAQGVVMAAVSGVVMGIIGGLGVGLATAVAAFMLSLVAAPLGLLQGLELLDRIAILRVVEAVVRIVVGLGLLLFISRTAGAAVASFAIGSALLVCLATYLCVPYGFPLRLSRRSVLQRLVMSSLGLGAVQLLVAMLGSLDSVAVQFGGLGINTVAGYQVASLLGRIPLYLSTAIAVAYYQPLARSTPGTGGPIISAALRLYLVTCGALFVLLATVPEPLLRLLAPGEANEASGLLWFTAANGLLIGLINVATTAHQALGAIRAVVRVMAPLTLLQFPLLVLSARLDGIHGFAYCLVTVSAVIAIATVADLRKLLRNALPGRRWWIGGVGLVVAALLLGSLPLIAWLALAVVVTFAVLLYFRRSAPARE